MRRLKPWLVAGRLVGIEDGPDGSARVIMILAGGSALVVPCIVAQSMTALTRTLFGRSDRELILSSPVNARSLLAGHEQERDDGTALGRRSCAEHRRRPTRREAEIVQDNTKEDDHARDHAARSTFEIRSRNTVSKVAPPAPTLARSS